MKTIVSIGLSTVGAGICFAAGYFVAKKKYEKMMDDAIADVKKVYSRKKPIIRVNNPEEHRETAEARDEKQKETQAAIESEGFDKNRFRNEEQYTDYSGYKEEETPEDERPTTGIHIVTADEFQEEDDYRTINLTYYRDDILADERDEVVDIPEAILGDFTPGELLTGGETVVFLRNDTNQTYIEIVKDERVFYGDIIPDEEDY